MASLQDIRRRIRSVKSIQQITKAMKMVAAARLRRAQMAAVANKPYADKMAEVVENVAANVTDFKHPLLETYEAAEKELALEDWQYLYKYAHGPEKKRIHDRIAELGGEI